MQNYKSGLIATAIVVAVVAGLYTILQLARSKPTKPASQTGQEAASTANSIRYLPLGDSYTIGQSVAVAERWPNQLAKDFKPSGKSLSIVANPSVTGYTSQDLIDKELPLVRQLKPDFVTVLIGVNDYVQGVAEQTFQTNLELIVKTLQADMTKPQNILLVTIPDYAKTPAGAQYGDPVAATEAIQRFNQIIIALATKAKLPYADIFGVSQQVVGDRSLTASDGLHPSGKQYAAWTVIIKQSLEASDL